MINERCVRDWYEIYFMFTAAGLHSQDIYIIFSMFLCLLSGDKGDTCVQCEGFGPPGLPGPQGPKGDRGKWIQSHSNYNSQNHRDCELKEFFAHLLNMWAFKYFFCCSKYFWLQVFTVCLHVLTPTMMSIEEAKYVQLSIPPGRTSWVSGQQRRKGSNWTSWKSWKTCK